MAEGVQELYGISPYGFNSGTLTGTNNLAAGTSFNGGMPGIDFSFPGTMNFANTIPQQKEKVGFWEGLKSFGKGLIKPIVTMIKNPLKTALTIGVAAAIIVGTGGAATPFLIALGLGFGLFQMGKGTYNFFSKNTKAERLAALEDVGEGTFTVGASLAGARSYAKGTSVGSAVDKNLAALKEDAGIFSKAGAAAKGYASDAITAVKDAPHAVRQTGSMIMSGEFKANIIAGNKSAPLALERKKVHDILKEKGRHSEEFKTALAEYKSHRDALIADSKANYREINANESFIEQRILNNYKNIPQFMKTFMIEDAPSTCIAAGIGEIFRPNVDPQLVAMGQFAGQAAGYGDTMKAFGLDTNSLYGMSPETMLGMA